MPVAPVRGTAERSLADTILVTGDYRQHDLPEGALLGERPIAATEVHLLLDGLLVIEADHQPVLEAGPRRGLRPVGAHVLQQAARHGTRHDRLSASCPPPMLSSTAKRCLASPPSSGRAWTRCATVTSRGKVDHDKAAPVRAGICQVAEASHHRGTRL